MKATADRALRFRLHCRRVYHNLAVALDDRYFTRHLSAVSMSCRSVESPAMIVADERRTIELALSQQRALMWTATLVRSWPFERTRTTSTPSTEAAYGPLPASASARATPEERGRRRNHRLH